VISLLLLFVREPWLAATAVLAFKGCSLPVLLQYSLTLFLDGEASEVQFETDVYQRRIYQG